MALAAAAAFPPFSLRSNFDCSGSAGGITRREILAKVCDTRGGEARGGKGRGHTDAPDATESALTTDEERATKGASA
jgi:hypothetical protein